MICQEKVKWRQGKTITDKLFQIRNLIVRMALGRVPPGDTVLMWNDRLIAVARAHQLGPWLYHEFRANPGFSVPTEMLSILRRDYLVCSLAALERDSRLTQLLESFKTSGIPVVLLKGIYLGKVVYGDPALRPMNDVDILVTEDQYEHALAVLASLDYKLQVEVFDRFHRELHPALAHIRENRPHDAVDLHRGLWFMDYYRLSPSIVREDVIESNPPQQCVNYLSLELNFIHVALHNLTHAGYLRDWLDLVLLVSRPDFRWNRMIHIARSLQVLRPLYWVFKELTGNWSIVIPDHIQQAVSEYTPHWLEDRVIRDRFRYAWRLASRFRYIRGWNARLAYLRVGLFPPASYRYAVAGTTEWLPYLKSKLSLFLHFTR